jgi:organic radical activating enzyme
MNNGEPPKKAKGRKPKSEYFCMAPFVHMYVHPDGTAGSCCQLHGNLGSLKDNTLKELWNCKENKNMRLKMMNGEKVSACKTCYKHESNGLVSLRNHINNRFERMKDVVSETERDGSLKFNYKYFDIRFSNLCNFRCRTCNHSLSSSFFKEAKLLEEMYENKHQYGLGLVGTSNEKKIIHPAKTPEKLWGQIEQIIPDVDTFYFAGGEPILMEEHYKIIKMLEERERFDVTLSYSSNFSTLQYKGYDFLEAWSKFDKVEISVSLDAMGKQAEYIRKGQNWAKTEENLAAFREKCPDHDLELTPTMSLMSAYHLSDLHKYVVDKGYFKADSLYIIPLHSPFAYKAQVIPPKLKEKIKDKYQEHCKFLADNDVPKAVDIFNSSIEHMFSEDLYEKHFSTFINHAKTVDVLRDEYFFDIFPEYKDYE